MDISAVSTFWLLCIMLLSLWVHKYLFKALLSIPLVIYPEVELLDGNSIFLFFKETSQRVGHDWATKLNWTEGNFILFSIMSAPFYFPTSSVQRFHFLHILINTGYFLSLFSFDNSHVNKREVVISLWFWFAFP